MARSRADEVVATDGELLMRFVRQRDHTAFAQIVERHGRLVWMICRQVLRHHQDVEDAFQATFLILAERAHSVRASDSAAAWLFGVAQRTALAARRKRSRRREEVLVDEPPVGEESVRAIDNREMLYILLREIENLPARYQAPLVMRYLEGQSRRAIADQTDSTVSQIQGRLVRGRRILRSRFLRRGVSLSLAAGAVAGNAATAEAAITSALVDSTAETCLKVKTSGAVSGLSPAVLVLVREGVSAMWVTFMTKCTAIVSTVALTAGIVWAAQQGGGAGDASTKAATKKSDLQVASGKAAEGHQLPTVDAKARTGQAVDYVKNQSASHLQDRIQETWSVLTKQMNERAETTASLELEELEKAALQRKIQYLQGLVNELDTPAVPSSGEDVPKEVREKRDQLRNTVTSQLDKAKGEMKTIVWATARLSAELELTQMKVAQRQREIDELTRLSLQIEPPISAESRDDGKLTSGEAIRIRVSVNGAEVIADSLTIEPMGTVALGPDYGRVKIEGLSILDAESVIKDKLDKIFEKAAVQVTMVNKGETSASKRGAVDSAGDYAFRSASGECRAGPAVSHVARSGAFFARYDRKT